VTLATLLDAGAGTALPLPAVLEERYGGALRMPDRTPHVFANFVSTLDGVVSYNEPGREAAGQVSGGHPADRFVLALLRAVADAVIVGAGTLRKEPKSVWTAASVQPDLASAFAELRTRMRLRPHPTTILVSASGELDADAPVFHGDAPVVIATTTAGAERVAKIPNATVRVVADRAPLPSRALVALALRESGGGRILTEGGPTLLGRFLEDAAVDELFLTIAPRLAGRSGEHRRIALVEGVAFRPEASPHGALLSLKVSEGYLFTRFAIARG
jgi:riboflavin biosynthesis pyrimidine reductase